MRQKFRQAVGWSFVAQSANHVLSVAFVIVLARYLEPADFGMVSAAMVVQVLAINLGTWGVDKELQQREGAGDHDFSVGFWVVVLIAVGIFAIVYAASPFLSQLIDAPASTVVFRVLATVIVFRSATEVLSARLIRSFRMARFAAFTLLSNLLAGVAAIVLAVTGYGVFALVAQQLVAAAAGFVLVLIVGQWVPRLTFDKRLAGELLRFGLPMSASNLLTVFNRESPKLIVGAILGPTALGFFAMASRVAELITSLLVLTYSRVAIPEFARLRSDPGQLSSAYLVSVRIISSVLLPAFVLTAIVSRDLISLLFGSNWQPAAPVLTVLSGAGILSGMTFVNGAVIISLGKPVARFWFTLARAIIGTVLLIVAGPMGLVGMAGALVMRGVIIEPIQLQYVLRQMRIPLRDYLACQSASLSGAFILAIVALIVQGVLTTEFTPLRLLLILLPGIFVYLLWISARDDKIAAAIKKEIASWSAGE